mmetsp:Transcript_9762/g.13098  ORF Transcript_9762/g.13098 Transcript_9762/m.13098 type:complete len:165 (-) Transcript_9762:317-811(-)
MKLSDPHRLILLTSLILFSLSTIFTSRSFKFDEGGVGKLNPQYRPCIKVREAAKTCLDKTTSSDSSDGSTTIKRSCQEQMSTATKCVTAVKKAYQIINLSGCTKLIQDVALCQAEWCSSYGSSKESCSKHCDVKKADLRVCETKHVGHHVKKAGLDFDSSMLFE